MKIPKLLFFIFLAAGLIFIVNYNLFFQQKQVEEKKLEEKIVEEGRIYERGRIKVNIEKKEISFVGEVNKDKGWVQFLLFTQGYTWLEDESAITSEAMLVDLQKAFALIDWEMWDDIWHRRRTSQSKNILLFLQWEEKGEIKKLQASEVLLFEEERLAIEDLIFLGSPYFDQIALEAPPLADCITCPIFPLEQKALREEFIRESGNSGYEINSALFPPRKKEVLVIIKIKEPDGRLS